MISLLGLQILIGLALGAECEHSSDAFRCVQYVRNYDADTINFNIPNIPPLFGQDIPVRVAGLDTPEIKGRDVCEKEMAQRSRDEVTKLMSSAKNIHLLNVRRDKYFRILADVEFDGIDLRSRLMEMGYAYTYDGGKKRRVDWCLRSKETK